MKINYESFDGNFYRLEPTEPHPKIDIDEWDPDQCDSYPWGSVVSLYWDTDTKNKKYFLLKQVTKEDNPTPIVRAGKDHSRCPHCRERKCLSEGQLLDYDDRPLKKLIEYTSGSKLITKLLLRKICSCISPKVKPKSKLFILEYLEHEKSELFAFYRTIHSKHCLVCNARWDMISFETVFTKNVYINDGSDVLTVILWCEVCGTVQNGDIILEQGQKPPKSKEEIIVLLYGPVL